MSDGSNTTSMSAPATPATPAAPLPVVSAAPTPAPASGPAVQPGVAPGTSPAPDASGYTAFTLPEGMELNEGLLKEFLPVAKSLGLKQEQAQQLVDIQTRAEKARLDAQNTAWNTTMTEWQTTARQDQEYGGVKFDENLAVATAAVKKYGSPELIQALELTGIGNHPEMIRFAYRVGKAMSAGRMVSGSSAPAGESDPAKILFPNMA